MIQADDGLRLTKRSRLELNDFFDLCAVFQGACATTPKKPRCRRLDAEKREPAFKGR